MRKTEKVGLIIHQFQEILLGQITEGRMRGLWTIPEIFQKNISTDSETLQKYLNDKYSMNVEINPIAYNEVSEQDGDQLIIKRNYLAKLVNNNTRFLLEKTDNYEKMRFIPVDVLLDMDWLESDMETVQMLMSRGLGE